MAGTRTRHFQGSRAQPKDSLSPGSQVDGGTAQAVAANSAATRERDKNAAHGLGWKSQASEYMDCEACDSDEDFMSELENEYSDEANGTDMDKWMR